MTKKRIHDTTAAAALACYQPDAISPQTAASYVAVLMGRLSPGARTLLAMLGRDLLQAEKLARRRPARKVTR